VLDSRCLQTDTRTVYERHREESPFKGDWCRTSKDLYCVLISFPADCMNMQLLIDLQEVKACLLKLPGESVSSSRYNFR
jgi:hypothetical protein